MWFPNSLLSIFHNISNEERVQIASAVAYNKYLCPRIYITNYGNPCLGFGVAAPKPKRIRPSQAQQHDYERSLCWVNHAIAFLYAIVLCLYPLISSNILVRILHISDIDIEQKLNLICLTLLFGFQIQPSPRMFHRYLQGTMILSEVNCRVILYRVTKK